MGGNQHPQTRTGLGQSNVHTIVLDGEHHLLVQEVVSGPFCMVQAIFDHGRLIAFHCWQRLREGARGSSSAKMSIQQPLVERHLRQLGEYLGWHGCLAIDYLLDPQQQTPLYIDANPRLVESMNAALSGLNLAEVLVRLSLGERLPETLSYRSGVRSHMLLMALLGLAEQGGTRKGLLGEIWQAGWRWGMYRASQEELTPFRLDPFSLVPAFVLSAQLLIDPTRGLTTASKAVTRYSLSEEAIQEIGKQEPEHV